jgi:hypothetical protein
MTLLWPFMEHCFFSLVIAFHARLIAHFGKPNPISNGYFAAVLLKLGVGAPTRLISTEIKAHPPPPPI